MSEIERLLDIMRQLRDPETGCPWDVRQTFASVAPYTLEEAHEVLDAIHRNDLDDLRDELGDLLLQVVFHAQIGTEMNAFTFDDVVSGICDKMIRRHPHVFADAPRDSHTSELWEMHKLEEKRQKGIEPPSSALDGVFVALPALMRSQKLQKKAAKVGFDWPSVEPVFEKIVEELQEVQVAYAQNPQSDDVFEELGDLLFSVVNLCRKMGFDAEQAMAHANAKFVRRFEVVEALASAQNMDMKSENLDALEHLWSQAKAQEGHKNNG